MKYFRRAYPTTFVGSSKRNEPSRRGEYDGLWNRTFRLLASNKLVGQTPKISFEALLLTLRNR